MSDELTEHELRERQSWIDHDNELMQMDIDERYEEEYLTVPIEVQP